MQMLINDPILALMLAVAILTTTTSVRIYMKEKNFARTIDIATVILFVVLEILFYQMLSERGRMIVDRIIIYIITYVPLLLGLYLSFLALQSLVSKTPEKHKKFAFLLIGAMAGFTGSMFFYYSFFL